MSTHPYSRSLNNQQTRTNTQSIHPTPIKRQRRFAHGQRKPTPKPKLSDPFADLWKCRAFAILTQGCTPSETAFDIAEIHARILTLAATAAAGGQITSQYISKPTQVREGIKKRAAKPVTKIGKLGLRRSSRNIAHPEVPRDASRVERSRIGANNAGKASWVIGDDWENYLDEEANVTTPNYTGEKWYNGGEEVRYEGEGARVTPYSVRQEEGGEKIGESITASETDWDEGEEEGGKEEDIDTGTITDPGGGEYNDEEVQESITVLNMDTDNEMCKVLPGAVSSGIYLGNPKRKRQSAISEYFRPNSQVVKRRR